MLLPEHQAGRYGKLLRPVAGKIQPLSNGRLQQSDGSIQLLQMQRVF
jgi:hypothetical protein